jgi:methyl-accepting chemotaxis protein
MKEADRHARMAITYSGLRWLSENTSARLSRKELFLVKKSELERSAFRKAVKNTKWQKECLARMVETQLLRGDKRNGQMLYALLDKDKLNRIVKEKENLGGLELARLLFPKDTGINPEEIPEELRDMLGQEGVPVGVLMEEERSLPTNPAVEDIINKTQETKQESLAERMRKAKSISLFSGMENIKPPPYPENREPTSSEIAKAIANNTEFNRVLVAIRDSLQSIEQTFSHFDGRLKAITKTLDRHTKDAEKAAKQEAEARRKDVTEFLELFTLVGENQHKGSQVIRTLDAGVKKLAADIGKDREVTAKVVQNIHNELKSVARSYQEMVQAQSNEGRLQEAMDMIKRGLRDFEEGQALLLEHQAEKQSDEE